MCNTNNNKRLLLRIYIENSYKSIRKAVVQINEKRWTGTSSTRILTWPMCIWNGTRLHYSSGKPEWKPLWSTTKSSRIAKLKNYAMITASPMLPRTWRTGIIMLVGVSLDTKPLENCQHLLKWTCMLCSIIAKEL